MPGKSVKELKLFLTSVIIGVLISAGGASVCVGFVTMTKAFDVKLFNIYLLPVAFLAILVICNYRIVFKRLKTLLANKFIRYIAIVLSGVFAYFLLRYIFDADFLPSTTEGEMREEDETFGLRFIIFLIILVLLPFAVAVISAIEAYGLLEGHKYMWQGFKQNRKKFLKMFVEFSIIYLYGFFVYRLFG